MKIGELLGWLHAGDYDMAGLHTVESVDAVVEQLFADFADKFHGSRSEEEIREVQSTMRHLAFVPASQYIGDTGESVFFGSLPDFRKDRSGRYTISVRLGIIGGPVISRKTQQDNARAIAGVYDLAVTASHEIFQRGLFYPSTFFNVTPGAVLEVTQALLSDDFADVIAYDWEWASDVAYMMGYIASFNPMQGLSSRVPATVKRLISLGGDAYAGGVKSLGHMISGMPAKYLQPAIRPSSGSGQRRGPTSARRANGMHREHQKQRTP